ncbi:MAG: hypothetical protein ABH826_01150 [Patescibacteria group bacterium]
MIVLKSRKGAKVNRRAIEFEDLRGKGKGNKAERWIGENDLSNNLRGASRGSFYEAKGGGDNPGRRGREAK